MPRSIWLLLVLILFATAPYTLGPILVRFKSSVAADPTFHEIPDDHARVLFPQNFLVMFPEFEALGFSLVCHLSSSSITSHLHLMTSLFINRTSKTFAVMGFIRSQAPAVVNFIEFHADFEDGSQLDTANSSTVRVFYDAPGKSQVKVPHLKNPSALYQVHLYLMRQHRAPACLPEPGTEKEHFINSMKETLAEQAGLGFYFLDETKQRYRHTWRAAYRAAYRHLWPFKQIHQRRQEQEGRRIAAEALRSRQ
jgi:hypothetical protein